MSANSKSNLGVMACVLVTQAMIIMVILTGSLAAGEHNRAYFLIDLVVVAACALTGLIALSLGITSPWDDEVPG